MTEMITIKAHRYAGKMRAPGDKYEASGQNEKLVKALGWAKVAPPPDYFVPEPEPKPRSYARRDLAAAEVSAAEPAPSTEPDAEAPRPKRAYRRRDLTAED